MRRRGSKLVRYSIILIILIGGVFATLGTVLSIYDGLQTTVSWLPVLLSGSLIGQLLNPWIVGIGLTAVATTGLLARHKFGTLGHFIVWLTELLTGWTDPEEPTVVGRIKHQEVVWRFDYFRKGPIRFDRRECAYCGRELIQQHLSEQKALAENTAMSTDESSQAIADEAWENVFGKEKAYDHKETQALACTRCNFSVPGDKDTLDGLDGAKAMFRYHLDMLETDGRLKKYRAQLRRQLNREPSPSDIWDAYVQDTNPEDALPVSPSTASEFNEQKDGTLSDDAKNLTEAQEVFPEHA